MHTTFQDPVSGLSIKTYCYKHQKDVPSANTVAEWALEVRQRFDGGLVPRLFSRVKELRVVHPLRPDALDLMGEDGVIALNGFRTSPRAFFDGLIIHLVGIWNLTPSVGDKAAQAFWFAYAEIRGLQPVEPGLINHWINDFAYYFGPEPLYNQYEGELQNPSDVPGLYSLLRDHLALVVALREAKRFKDVVYDRDNGLWRWKQGLLGRRMKMQHQSVERA
jgi:hypothetical protein